MEIVARDWKLISEVAALNINEGEIDFDRHSQLKRLMQTAEMLVPTMYAAIDRKMETIKPAVFVSSEGRQTPSFGSTSADLLYLRNQSPETKSERDWQRQSWLEIEDHCWNVPRVQSLLEFDKCHHEKEIKMSGGWEIRRHLDFEFMQDWHAYERLQHHGSIDAMDEVLNTALQADDDLNILDQWVGLKNYYIHQMTQEDMQPVIAWRGLKAWEATSSSGQYPYVLNGNAKYLFTFHRYACSLEQAYRIIDHLHSKHIPAAVVLLDPAT